MIEFHTLGETSLRAPDGRELRSVLVQPKRVALLAYLALDRPLRFHRRDELLALFWPELDAERARHALRQSLYVLRRALGKEMLEGRGSEEVGLDFDRFWCDAAAFEQATDEEHWADALELYRGDLLPGFFVADAPDVERWLDRTRDRLRRCAADAARALAEERERAGRGKEAVDWARKAVAFAPFDETGVRRLIALLDRLGDRAGALRSYEKLEELLASEFESEPSAETRALVETIRGRDAVREEVVLAPAPDLNQLPATESPAPESSPAGSAEPQPSAAPAPVRVLRGRWILVAAVLAAVALLGAAAAVLGGRESPPSAPTIAVGEIDSYGTGDSTEIVRALPGMLATNLARAPALQVVSRTRLYEIVAQLDADGQPGALQQAARRTGVRELIEGTLYRHPDGEFQLDLRRVELATGMVRQAYRVQGRDPFSLVNQATVELMADLGVPNPLGAMANVSNTSPIAYRFYEEGLRAYYEGHNEVAERLFSAALAEDSTFAMAAYYRALSNEDVDHVAFRSDLGRAVRFAEDASDPERLLIQTAWAREMDEPRQLALAETLVVRYPSEPDGHLFFGEALLWSGDFEGALPHLRQVVALDSLSLRGLSPRCRACDALRAVVSAHTLADSLGAAERVAREWAEVQQGSARAWRTLGLTLEYQGQWEEAAAARSLAASLGSDNPRDPVYPAVLAIRAGDFARADRLLAQRQELEGSLEQQNVLWFLVISQRAQNRLDEALETARRYREAVLDAETSAQRKPWEAVLEAQVLMEMGRGREAAALWQRMADYPFEPESASRNARHRTWTLTQKATALAAAGDTAALPALADTIQLLGIQSAYGRDPRLHHYVRGLLWMARGDTARAAASLRRAVFSLTSGYGQINLELGRALLALDRPREAIASLRPALRGPLDAGNLYVTPTELHALLARAYRAAGEPDSAAVHARWVARASS